MEDRDKRIDGPGRDIEGAGESSGLPAKGQVVHPGDEPLGRKGLSHWRESTITEPGLDDRGDVFFAAVEMTRMPMILTDPNLPDNPVVFANKAFLDLTGYEESEVLGRNCRFLQGAQSDRQTVAELRDAIEARESISVEILNYRRDGSAFWNAVFIGPVYSAEGSLLYFFASQLDVTRRRETEQSYRQAQKMEAVGQLTAGLAHDFNNLLQVVDGNLEILAGKLENPALERYVKNARGAAERGVRLTRQLLAFARKTRLEPQPVNLSDLVSEFTGVMESTVGRQVDLHLSLRRRLPLVMVDPDQLEMALLNVLLNARDAMPTGGLVTITTRTVHLNGDAATRDLTEGEYVALEVKDEGQGMAPHVIRRATEPFFTTKGVGKGTGLGLAMASGFAQQSRGRLEIESEVGDGALIRMLFPVSAGAEIQAMQAPAPRVAMTDPAHGGEHILVVEDQHEVLELATEILQSVGYRVTAAVDGDDGLAKFEAARERDPFDLVFTDILMPGGLNGLNLAEEVRKRSPETPVLLTTGYNEDLAIDGPGARGMDVLGKPYRRSELTDRIRQALKGDATQQRRRPSEFGAAEA